ncbi:MAG TPA: chemotaxis protein CheB [Acidimicrobiales bacterium]|nr:chemotaxis protein CheB [Acidimicrobiales bacterium]
MTAPPVVVVGASAGGVGALEKLASHLPRDLEAAVLVVLHVSPAGTSVLPQILQRAGPLSAAHAVDREPLVPTRIYVAPPDQHLLVDGGVVRVARGAPENGHRPAVDPLFRSAARSHGRSVVAVVLSGSLDDGSTGLCDVKEAGGVCVVQQPSEALYPGMPEAAIRSGCVDHILPIADIAKLVTSSGLPPISPGAPTTDELGAMLGDADPHDFGDPSPFSCPECGGVLRVREMAGPDRFRCRVGHQFSVESLVDRQQDMLDEALWAGYRALQEQADLCRRVAERLRSIGNQRSAEYASRAEEANRRAVVLRQVLMA